nr:hypothetical protein [Deltaproteobacteria bacterium]
MDLINALTPVLTALAGGLIGFLSARAIWKAQEAQRRRNVAQGLLLELNSMEKMLTGWANVLGGANKVKIDPPLYPPAWLYHVLQKEIFAFDQNLSRSLFQFHMRVLEAGGWSAVLSLRRKGRRVAYDERVLGSSDFVQKLLSEAGEKEKQSLRLITRIPDLAFLAVCIAKGEGIDEALLRSGTRKRLVARFLGVTTSCVNRLAASEEIPEISGYL